MYNYHNSLLELQHIVHLRTPTDLEAFISHPAIQLPFREFISHSRDLSSLEEGGWYAVLRRISSPDTPITIYTWPNQDKRFWGYEQHVGRFIFQVHHGAWRSELPWWRRNRCVDSYEHWGWEVFALLMVLCERWLGDGGCDLTVSREWIAGLDRGAEERALVAIGQLSGTANEPGKDGTSAQTGECTKHFNEQQQLLTTPGVCHSKPKENDVAHILGSCIDERHPAQQTCRLRRRKAVMGPVNRRLLDWRPGYGEYILTAKVGIDTADRICSVTQTLDDYYQPTFPIIKKPVRKTRENDLGCGLKRSDAVKRKAQRSRRYRQVSGLEEIASVDRSDGAWASCPLPWRHAGPGRWPCVEEFEEWL